MIRIGFSCKVVGLSGIAMRCCTLRNASDARLVKLSSNNLDVLMLMVDYCYKNNIKLMRISSDVIPFASHERVSFDWRKIFGDRLDRIGKFISQTGLRVSMHPGQYTVLNSPNGLVVDAAVRDIAWHADFLDSLNTDDSAKIILHIGGVYGDKTSSISRFIKNFELLPANAKRRLVVENDERNYNIEDTLYVSKQLCIPVALDVLHHNINSPEKNDLIYWIRESSKTWRTYDGAQKIHYSQQKIGAKTGAHSETIDTGVFLEFYKQISDMNIDIMLEVKDKNISAVNCINAIHAVVSS